MPAEKFLPDDTLVMLTIPDSIRARQIYANSPQGRFWNDPAMKDFKDKFMGKVSGGYLTALEHDLGLHLEDYTNLPQGQFTLACIQNGWQGKQGQPAFFVLLDTKDKSSRLKANLDELKKKWINLGKNIRTEKIRDVDFSVVSVSKADFIKPSTKPAEPLGPDLPPPMPPDTNNMTRRDIYIGQAGSLLIACDSPKVIEKVLARLSGGSVNVLSDFAAFDANHAMFHDVPVYGWINIKAFVDVFSQSSEADADAAAGAFGFSADKVLAGLGLNAVKSIAFNCRFSDEGSQLNVTLSVPDGARTGLVKLFAGDAKDCNPPAFVPADAVKFQRWRFDGPKAWPTIRKTIVDIFPTAGGVLDMALGAVEADAKDKDPSFDLNKNLFGNLSGDIVTYEKNPKPGSTDPNSGPSIFLLGSPNPDQLADAMKRLLVVFSPQAATPADREFLGHKIYTVTLPTAPPQRGAPPPPTRTLSYTTANSYVAFSSDAGILEEYLRSAESQPKALREMPGLTDAMQKVAGSDASLFGFSNEAESMRASFDAMRKSPAPDNFVAFGLILPFLGYGDVKSKDWVDVTLLPPYDKISKYFYFSVYGTSTTPDGIN
ncbi:MAG TPA: hypothetical protein VFB72_03720, partial [Verrucomicrobiae bacterium]|nr:hypothetical protein [Verrucomicrobiae bacterium]